MGATLAVWGLIALIVASTGVAYAAPIAGVGGFNLMASEITADELVLYPGVDDTSAEGTFPQTVAELRNAGLRDLTLYKTFDLQHAPGMVGQARLQLNNYGEVEGGNVVVKSSAITSGQATFEGFELDEDNTNDPSTALTIRSEQGTELTDAGIQAHYLAADSISLDNLQLQVCYDPDDDGQWEYGNCIVGDPVGEGINNPGTITEVETGQLPPDNDPSEEDDDGDNITGGDVAGPVQDAVGGVVDAVEDAVDAVGDAIDSIF
jgi:hypothetical protein